jgi:hypothetical protein
MHINEKCSRVGVHRNISTIVRTSPAEMLYYPAAYASIGVCCYWERVRIGQFLAEARGGLSALH